MSRNTPLTSAVAFLSNAVFSSCITESGWVIHESPGRNPDCEEYLDIMHYI